MVEHGDTAKYIKMINEPNWCQLRWLPRDSWVGRAHDVSVIDTVHILLVNLADGSSRLRHTEVRKYCGPAIKTLFLHSSVSNPITTAQVLEIIEKCPNLTALSMREVMLMIPSFTGLWHVSVHLVSLVYGCQCARGT